MRPDNKFDGHRGTVTRLHAPNNQLAIIAERPEDTTSIPVFKKDQDKDDRTQTRSSRHHGDDRTETRSSRANAPNQLAIIKEKDDRSETRSSRRHGDDRSETRSSRHHADDRTETRSSRANADNQLAIIKEKDDRTKTRSSRHHGDDRTETRSSRRHGDDRTETRSSRHHADDRTQSRSSRDDSSTRTLTQSRFDQYDTYDPNQPVHAYYRSTPRGSSTYDDSSVRGLEMTLASTTLNDSSARGLTRSSSTRGGSSTHDLEKRIASLEKDKASALERKVKDLERKLEDMYIEKYVENANRAVDMAERRAADMELERRARRNAYYEEEVRKISAYARGFDGEAYYQQLLINNVNLSRYL